MTRYDSYQIDNDTTFEVIGNTTTIKNFWRN